MDYRQSVCTVIEVIVLLCDCLFYGQRLNITNSPTYKKKLINEQEEQEEEFTLINFFRKLKEYHEFSMFPSTFFGFWQSIAPNQMLLKESIGSKLLQQVSMNDKTRKHLLFATYSSDRFFLHFSLFSYFPNVVWFSAQDGSKDEIQYQLTHIIMF